MRISDRLKEEVKARQAEWKIQKNASKKTVLHGEGGSVTLRPKEWVAHGSIEYEVTFERLDKTNYKGNVKEEKMYSLTSQAKDWFLELQLRSDKYTLSRADNCFWGYRRDKFCIGVSGRKTPPHPDPRIVCRKRDKNSD